MKQRNYALDYMKAFAIYLVVMDHLISMSDGIQNPFRTFIYSLHMPLFFIVSGILASRKLTTYSEIASLLKNKLRLVIPVVVVGIGDVLIMKNSINDFFIWHKFGLWFLWTLFLFFVIYALSQLSLLKNKNTKVEILMLILPAVLCIILRKWQDTEVGGVFNFLNLYNYCFFILGVMIKRFNLIDFVLKEEIQLFAFLLYVAGLSTGLPMLNIPMKACGILFVFGTFTEITSKIDEGDSTLIHKLILKVGHSSLYIYIIHFYFINSIRRLPQELYSIIYSSPSYYLPIYSCVAIFIIFTCILISDLLNTNKYIRMCVFGAKK